jgi:hypothetical protein
MKFKINMEFKIRNQYFNYVSFKISTKDFKNAKLKFYLEDALRVVALEVSILASDLPAGIRFIASIRAVGCAVAVPGLWDAESGRVALELPVAVALVGRQ